MMLLARCLLLRHARLANLTRGKRIMNSKTKFGLGVLTALAMLLLTFLVPRGGALRDAQLVLFPVTVGVWAIFVLLFVKLK
jgi:hypothetical protein